MGARVWKISGPFDTSGSDEEIQERHFEMEDEGVYCAEEVESLTESRGGHTYCSTTLACAVGLARRPRARCE